MPIFIVDPAGNLVFYNEPAENILGRRYDETGLMPAEEWSTIFEPVDQDGEPMRPEELPMVIAIAKRCPSHKTFWIRGLDENLREIEVTAFPLIAQAERFLGAVAIFLGGGGMKITLWGTRGSLASPGPDTVRFSGNTSCIAVEGSEKSLLVLDARTGIRKLGLSLPTNLKRVDILLTHLHMDHLQGLPFFAPLRRPGVEVHIWGPASTTLRLSSRVLRCLSPPLFPVSLRELPSILYFHELPSALVEIGEFIVTTQLVIHLNPTVGYRIREHGATLTYLPDHEPALGNRTYPRSKEWTSGYVLAEGADLLIHDAQYTTEEYEERVGYGHSSIRQAVLFGELAGVKRLLSFHHDPAHSDAMLDKMIERTAA